mmetsp:Transcript_56516/g.120038  ORF Transcript_56516/g.120038 Transcript_56516/m.120038 type:complete len:121 (-) Transcript_56516:203-565(-)
MLGLVVLRCDSYVPPSMLILLWLRLEKIRHQHRLELRLIKNDAEIAVDSLLVLHTFGLFPDVHAIGLFPVAPSSSWSSMWPGYSRSPTHQSSSKSSTHLTSSWSFTRPSSFKSSTHSTYF